MSLNIILYTPNKTMCNTVSEEIFLPTPDGEICIQPRHQQLVSALSISTSSFSGAKGESVPFCRVTR